MRAFREFFNNKRDLTLTAMSFLAATIIVLAVLPNPLPALIFAIPTAYLIIRVVKLNKQQTS